MSMSMACRSSSGDDDDDNGTPDGGGTGDDTIYQVQDPANAMPTGTAVTLENVVIVAIDTYGGRTGSIYVMEPEGGAYSGVQVYLSGTAAADYVVGDLINVEGGVKDEFTLEESCDRASDCTITEISAALEGEIQLTKVGDGTVPEPEVLNPWDLAADDTEAEKWEGVLIRFDNVRAFGAPHNVSSTDDTLKEFDATGPFVVSSSLTELGDSIAKGDCFASVTGIGDYFFDYKLLPRSAADMATGGTDCLAEEEGETLCTDEADNDHDGFSDCADFSCQDTVESCTTTTTVVDLQSDQVAANSAVSLEGVVVTAIDRFREHLWVQDNGVNAHHNGIYIHRGSSPDELDSQIQVGELVNVTGTFKYYYDMTEISNSEVTFVSGGPVDVEVLTDANTDTLGDLTTGAEWEGTVVRFTNVPVINADAGYGQATIGNSGSPLFMDDDCYQFDVSSISCLAEITGVVYMNTYDDHYSVLPRSADDVVGGGACD